MGIEVTVVVVDEAGVGVELFGGELEWVLVGVGAFGLGDLAEGGVFVVSCERAVGSG